ncbi:transient receptor potential cation channel subfamily A member 1 homolog [Lineus longissimus]|uniref:transient receptor potential cation channel subfamily A member 1 homolog n=1 Tax=Lineus longissimus TaxID=88925 RepID=UPI00315D93E8
MENVITDLDLLSTLPKVSFADVSKRVRKDPPPPKPTKPPTANSKIKVTEDVITKIRQYSRNGIIEDLDSFLRQLQQREIISAIHEENAGNDSPLHIAARYQHFSMVKYLVQNGADVNIEGEQNATPLQSAASSHRKVSCQEDSAARGRKESITEEQLILRYLFEKGALKKTDQYGRATLLYMSVCEAKMHAEDLLYIERKWKENKSEFQYIMKDEQWRASIAESLEYQEENIIRFLFDCGADLRKLDTNGRTALHYASIWGNAKAAKDLLQVERRWKERNIVRWSILSATDDQKMSALHLAILHNNDDVASFLIDNINKIDDVTWKDIGGSTPLHYACINGSVDIVQQLFSLEERLSPNDEQSWMVNIIDSEGNTALHLGIENRHREVVRICIEKGADMTIPRMDRNTTLHVAALLGDLETVRLLLDNNAPVNVSNAKEETPLHLATGADHHHVCRELIERSEDRKALMEKSDKRGLTALLLATVNCSQKTLDVLLQAGADVSATDKEDRSALYMHLATPTDNLTALENLLADQGIDAGDLFELKDRYLNTPLHITSKSGNVRIIKFLLDMSQSAESLRQGLSIVHRKDKDANTALHLAALSGHKDAVEILINAGAKLESRNTDGWKPLHYAAVNGFADICEILLKKGCVVDPIEKTKSTPLHLASSDGHCEVVRLLLKWRADVCRTDHNHHNCLDLAINSAHKDVAMAILDGDNWRQALDNETLPRQTTTGNERNQGWSTPFRKLIRFMPDVAEYVCNKCISAKPFTKSITTRQRDKDEDETVHCYSMLRILNSAKKQEDAGSSGREHHQPEMLYCDYEFVDNTMRREQIRSKDFTFSDYGQKRSGSTDPTLSFCHPLQSGGAIPSCVGVPVPGQKPFSEVSSSRVKKDHCLMIMVKHRREKLLTHPLTSSLLRRKWNDFGRYIYYSVLCIYLLFVFFLTGYIMSTIKMSPYQFRNLTNLESYSEAYSLCEKVKLLKESRGEDIGLPTFALISKFAIMGLAAYQVFFEVLQILIARKSYFKWENILKWLTYTTAFLLVIDIEEPCQGETGLRLDWQWQLGAISIFWAWVNLVLYIRLVPVFGIYVMMFTNILRTFLRFFPVFFLFVVAFALSFHTLLANQTPFSTAIRSLTKTSVMMIGELDYGDIFNAQEEALNDRSVKLWYEVATLIQFFLFLIFMSILIMNLLVGLAVDNISAVQGEAQMETLAMQVEFLLDVELLLGALDNREKERLRIREDVLEKDREDNWFRGMFPARGILSTSSIIASLKPELTDQERIEEEQKKIVTQVDKMDVKLTEMTQMMRTGFRNRIES